MCFFSISTKTKREQLLFHKPRIARRDITVYKRVLYRSHKLLDGGYFSWIQHYKYHPGRVVESLIDKTPIQKSSKWYFEIHNGLHSYIKNPMFSKNDDFGLIKEFIIPKGAEYYKNKTEYVSNKIIMSKKRAIKWKG